MRKQNKINIGDYAPMDQIYTDDNGKSSEIGREATVKSSSDALKSNMMEYDHSPVVVGLRTAETVRDCKLRRIQNDIRDVETLEQNIIPALTMEKDRQMVNRSDFDSSRMIAELSPIDQVKSGALDGVKSALRPKFIAMTILLVVMCVVAWNYIPDVFAKVNDTLSPVTVETPDSPKAPVSEALLEG